MDLKEDGETDIPTTSIRRKQDGVNNEKKDNQKDDKKMAGILQASNHDG